MNLKYVNRIRANIAIYSSKRTSNILDGTYNSIYRGKSMNFENLREYVLNDDVKDIDWKASARSGSLLVKQFIAEKKHNIMLVMDTGIKMDGNTNSGELKKEIALFSAGTIGYLTIKNGDYVGMMYNFNDKIVYKPLKYNLYNLEEYLTEYDKNALINNNEGINKTLEYICKNIAKRMIIFVITDLKGLNKIDDKILKKLVIMHDVLFIDVNDVFMFGENMFDLDNNEYIPNMLLSDKKLNELEKNIKNSLFMESQEKLKRNKISMVLIDNLEEITPKIIELLESHKYASNN